MKALTSKVVSESLEDFLRLNTDTLRVVVEKALLAQKAADAAKRAREMVKRKTVLTRAMLPGKLADCSNQDSHSVEICIVEGDSAGGSAKQVRACASWCRGDVCPPVPLTSLQFVIRNA